jgi:glutaredoxin 2
LEAGEIAALQLTTFTGAGIDAWVEDTKVLATGQFAQDLSKQYDQKLRKDLREFDVKSVGELINSFVQSIEGDEALVFTVLRQATQYPTFEQTVEDEVRFEIILQRVGGDWLVSDAKLLSPTPALRPRPFLDEQGGNDG